MNPFNEGTPEYEAYARQTGIDAVHAVFRRWLGAEYDLTALDAVLSVAASERLDGDPVWLLVVSGSGNAKTETVNALNGAGAFVTSTVTSDAALLSATPKKDRAKDATGGLLRKIGDAGLLVIKDFTSILSMNRDLRTTVLAALREVYDGRWDRSVGAEGGRTLTWEGRIVLIGATTTAYDAAHAVIATMGDRFALVRMDSSTGRQAAGRQALANVGKESEMRQELADAVGALLKEVDAERAHCTGEDMEVLLAVADLVTMSRTAVERDFKGDPIEAHAPEMPTRFAKMLGQVLRGALAIGIEPARARRIAVRVAADSMPPLRLLILRDVAAHPRSPCRDVVKRVQRPRTTVDRALQELHLIGLLEVIDGDGVDSTWRYKIADGVDIEALRTLDLAYQECHKLVRAEETHSLNPKTPVSDITGKHDPQPELDASAGLPSHCRSCSLPLPHDDCAPF